MTSPTPPTDPLLRDHSRRFENNRFVYPVLSRRSAGISIGVNLNPDKVCNFDCIYCQVDRVRQSEQRFVDTAAMLDELDGLLHSVTSGALYEHPRFAAVPPSMRRLNDVAFSGDGEPTTYRNFDQIVARCADLKRQHDLNDVKLVLITNASMFHRPHVQRGLATLMDNQGEIWAKLEAGTAEYFQTIDRTTIPFQRVLDNITWAARQWPIVVQSMFLRLDGAGPSDEELAAFCQRLTDILRAGGRIQAVQVYTVARPPAEQYVAPLPDAEVDRIAAFIERSTGLATRAYYGSAAD